MRYLLFISALLVSTLAADLASLEAELEKIKNRLDRQENKITLTSEETYFSIGGRIRLDMVYNDTSVGEKGGNSAYDFYVTPRSISGLGDQSHELAMQAKDSRIWIKTRKQTPVGKLQSFLEVDFLGSSGNEQVTNSHNIRLRHAYMTLAGMTMGQTNSTFMGSGTSDAIQGAVDIVLVRQPLVRYTHKIHDLSIDLALESAETTVTTSSEDVLAANDDQYPDLTARLRHQASYGELSLSLLGRQLRIHDDDQNITAVSQNTFAYHLSGRLKTFDHDAITFGWVQGTGLGRYVAYNYFSSATLDDANRLTLIPMTAYHLAYQHWWSQKLRSSVLFGSIKVDNDLSIISITPPTKSSQSYHANLRYSPFENMLFTLEYIYASKLDEAGKYDDLNRIYLSSSYDF